MKVIFLDFDGVLNSAASFLYEGRVRDASSDPKSLGPVNETLCRVCTSNFQHILDEIPEAKIVISSTWRELFDLDWLKDKLSSYGIDSTRVIDKTGVRYSGDRGHEIRDWMDAHPEVTDFVILDDNYIGGGYGEDDIVKTTWDTGLTLPGVFKAIKRLGGKPKQDEDDALPF